MSCPGPQAETLQSRVQGPSPESGSHPAQVMGPLGVAWASLLAQLGCPASRLPALGRAGLPASMSQQPWGLSVQGHGPKSESSLGQHSPQLTLCAQDTPTPSGDYVPRTTLAPFRFQMWTSPGLWGSGVRSVNDWGPPFRPRQRGCHLSVHSPSGHSREPRGKEPPTGPSPASFRQLPAQVADSTASRLPKRGQRVPSAATLPLLPAPSGSCPCPLLQTPGTGTKE